MPRPMLVSGMPNLKKQEYYRKNREKRLKYQQEWYARNKDKIERAGEILQVTDPEEWEKEKEKEAGLQQTILRKESSEDLGEAKRSVSRSGTKMKKVFSIIHRPIGGINGTICYTEDFLIPVPQRALCPEKS